MSIKPRLSCTGLNYKIGPALSLENIQLDVFPGELVGLIGPNGAGKSTLLKLLAGLLTADSGILTLDGKSLDSISTYDRAKLMGWIEQIGQIHWPLSVERLVTLGRIPHMSAWQKPGDDDKRAVDNALHNTDSYILKDRDATTLSGGERARVLLARALAAEPELILADEPVAALDLRHQLQTMELFRRYSTKEHAGILVLHDLSLAARYCDRLYLMNEGKIVVAGNAETVLTNEYIKQVYGVEVIAGSNTIPWIVPHKIIS